jgi:hypothetical protein
VAETVFWPKKTRQSGLSILLSSQSEVEEEILKLSKIP